MATGGKFAPLELKDSVTHAAETVSQYMERAATVGDQMVGQMSGAMSALAALTVPNMPIVAGGAPDAPPLPVLNKTDAPVLDGPFTVDMATVAMPTIGDLVGTLPDLGALPDAPTWLDINIPTAPGAIDTSGMPSRPTLDYSVAFPDMPAIDRPSMDALIPINVPTFEFPTMPDFSGQAPQIDFPVPNVFINWAEPVYHREILDEVEAEVRAVFAGGTGLPAAVEQALFDRANDRSSQQVRAAVEDAFATYASRNFSLPPGSLVANVNAVREEALLKTGEVNRDIYIQRSQQEIEQMRFAVQQGIAIEQFCFNVFDNATKRGFEVAKFAAENLVAMFNAQIGLFNAKVTLFTQVAAVYRTQIEAAVAKVQAYKTAIDAEAVKGQINQQYVEVYKAKVQALTTYAELYRVAMEGARIKVDTVRAQLEAYKTDVSAYAERLQADKIKFDAYDSQVRAEASKAGVMQAMASAYASEVQAIATKGDLAVKYVGARVDNARAQLAGFAAQVDQNKALFDAQARNMLALVEAFKAKVDAWSEGTKLDITFDETLARYYDMIARTSIAYSEMHVKASEANARNVIAESEVRAGALKAAGEAYAQLAAGAMAAIHVSAGVSDQASLQQAYNTSMGYHEQDQESWTHAGSK